MNITVSKVKRELKEKYGYNCIGYAELEEWINNIIKNTLKIVDTELIKHKNISIKK